MTVAKTAATPAATPVAVTIVAGEQRPARHARIRELLAAKPPAQRWAVVSIGLPGALADFARADRVASAGGCPCCSAGPVFNVTLVRLLRDRPWSRLLIEADGQAAAARLAERLDSGPLGAHLRVDEIVTV